MVSIAAEHRLHVRAERQGKMAAYPQSKTTKTRRMRGFEPAARVIGRDLRAPAEKRGFAEARLLTHWAEVVGADLAGMATPLRISYGRGFGGTLILLTSGAQAPLVEMRQGEIITRVNACYGFRAISRIQVTQTTPKGFAEARAAFAPAPPRKAPEPDPARLAKATDGLDTIKDEKLRDALATLARNIVTRTDP